MTSVTDVGAYPGSESFYGTFDQGGNVKEWTETMGHNSRELRGGSWEDIGVFLLSRGGLQTGTPGVESDTIGFRVSSP